MVLRKRSDSLRSKVDNIILFRILFVLFLVVFIFSSTTNTVAQIEDTSVKTVQTTATDCGFFCKIVNCWQSRIGGEAVGIA